jgi:hypothetical protein
MKIIEIKNQQLKTILGNFLPKLLAVDRSKFPYRDGGVTPEYACGEEYLTHMQGKKVDGFPEKTNGVDLLKYTTPHGSVRAALKTLDEELLAWSGSRNNAVKMLYPKGGYMGWHHNANAAGNNILLSWSEKGEGFFRYQNPITREIVTIQDTPGWTCKVGYYGGWSEKDKIIWHCASAEHEERFTLGYIIPHKGMWEDMYEDIQTS